MEQTKPIPLYHHRTDGGPEYLSDKFILCDNGHKEGVFEGANYVVRLDGEPRLTVRAEVNAELLEALEKAEAAMASLLIDHPRFYDAYLRLEHVGIQGALAKAKGESPQETIRELMEALEAVRNMYDAKELPHGTAIGKVAGDMLIKKVRAALDRAKKGGE